jgi:FADH2 O2-dependent halogenase
MQRLPTIRSLFANATPATSYIHQPQVAFATMPAHDRWAMLPSAAGFVDPLFSTGFVLTLLGISRLAEIFEKGGADEAALAIYAQTTLRELNQTGTLVGAAFRAFDRFDEFAEITRVYFASALWSETLRRLGRKTPEFLFANDPSAVSMIKELRAGRGAAERYRFLAKYDLGGLTDRSRRNWHPALASELFENAQKIPATPDEIKSMLAKCGF